MSTESLYPAGPTDVPADLTRPSNAYRRGTWIALLCLLIFVAAYCALAGWLVHTAYRLLGDALHGGPGALAGLLVGGCAGFLAIFMLKGLFFIERGNSSDTIEITAPQQPRLFEFLHRLADEAGAPRPARVFISPRVNASVFYDVSLANFLFPSRKNLEIGAALVNVLTLSEFKAVLAHEFGHFAQRSMAIGRWVYVAQQAAAQLIARRDAFDRFLNALSAFDFRVAWIGWSISLVVWSIRAVMDTLFRFVVLAQRALSRQMEYQADLVAVSLTGSDELIAALHKLHAADEAWGRTLQFMQAEQRSGRLPADLFALQWRGIEHFRAILNDDGYGRTPPRMADGRDGQPNPAALRDAKRHRVFKSALAQTPRMWATHPANSEREANAKKTYVRAPHDARNAWLLFDDVDQLRQALRDQLAGETTAQADTLEQTLSRFDQGFELEQYNPRYRGAYLGRPLTRDAQAFADLYKLNIATEQLPELLRKLYPAKLADYLRELRERQDDLAQLHALRDHQAEAPGGRIVLRGRELRRGQLPGAIAAAEKALRRVRGAIAEHDQQCRSVHLAIAAQASPQWRNYLLGLIATLHYVEHTQAELVDAWQAWHGTLSAVTAAGKVGKRGLKRLIAAGSDFHGVLAQIEAHKDTLQLDESLLEQLGVQSWAVLFDQFKPMPPNAEYMPSWVEAAADWMNMAMTALAALDAASTERLLKAEAALARHLLERTPLPQPSAPTRVPSHYSTRLLGEARPRADRLGWWARFKVADGWFATALRGSVAAAILGSVLSYGAAAGKTSRLTIYNGLARSVVVNVADQTAHVAPFSSYRLELALGDAPAVQTLSSDGAVIERLTPKPNGAMQHFVYNVAGAAPLIEWTAAYGNATAREPRLLGAPTWLVTHADIVFAEPPKSVKTKGGGAVREVLQAAGEGEPSKLLQLIPDRGEQRRVIDTRARWDQPNLVNSARWRELAARQ